MKIIDAHQHFWQYDAVKNNWINDDMKILQQDYMPKDLLPVLNDLQVAGCMAVQADQSMVETHFLLALAKNNHFIKGVIGWVDLLNPTIDIELEQLSKEDKLKGFRHLLQAEDANFMLSNHFLYGIGLLEKYGFTFDLLIYPHQMDTTYSLVEKFPGICFVLDHMAKPNIKNASIDTWKKSIKKLAQLPNVYCKISGLVTEANWSQWTSASLRPYLDIVIENFGLNRCMFGSDWPVCLLASSYENWLSVVKQYFSQFSLTEQAAFFAINCEKCYHLNEQ